MLPTVVSFLFIGFLVESHTNDTEFTGKKVQNFKNESGFSTVSAIIAVGLTVIASSYIIRTTTNGLRLQSKTSSRIDIAVIKDTVNKRLNCSKTLGLPNPPTPPLKCRDFKSPIPIKRANGTVLNPANKLGDWRLTAGCEGDELILKLTKAGKDPLTKKPWSKSVYAEDLFQGTSDFCPEYFEESSSSEPDLDCFWASRSDKDGIKVESSKYKRHVASFNGDNGSGEKWYGMRCKGKYNRTGCSLRTTEAKGDFDIRYINQGCFTDNEEWEAEGTLFMNCCKLRL